MKMPTHTLKITLLMLSVTALFACGRKDETVGQKMDDTIRKTTEAAKEVKSEAAASIEKSIEKTAETGKETTAKAAAAFDDAAITTSITAGIAKDPDLSAFKIDVETKSGKVSMHGSAPTAQARARAASIAESVKGVMSVDNQLTIKEKS